MTAFIVFICFSVIFAGLIAFNIMLNIMQKSNKSGDSKGDFYKNTKQPMRIHVLTREEYYKDMQENPELYGVKQLL